MSTGAVLQQKPQAIGEPPCSATAQAAENRKAGFGCGDSFSRNGRSLSFDPGPPLPPAAATKVRTDRSGLPSLCSTLPVHKTHQVGSGTTRADYGPFGQPLTSNGSVALQGIVRARPDHPAGRRMEQLRHHQDQTLATLRQGRKPPNPDAPDLLFDHAPNCLKSSDGGHCCAAIRADINGDHSPAPICQIWIGRLEQG